MHFSVIIPTYNRVDSLKKTILSIQNQFINDFEVIVVNDGSTDSTESYLTTFQGISGFKYINQNNQGPSSARNAGIKIAQGEYIAFTDDDCVVPQDWLLQFAGVFEKSGADVVGGVVKNCVQKNFFSELSQEITNFFVSHLNDGGKSSSFLTSNNIAYRADVLKSAGGFDERFKNPGGEERALNHKIISQGGKSIYADNIVVEHYHQMNFNLFLRQQLNYGKGSYLLYNILNRDFKKPMRQIPFSTYLSLMISFFKGNIFTGYRKFFLYGISQIIVMIGYTLQWLNFKSQRL